MPRPRVFSFGLFGGPPKSPDLDPTPTSPTFPYGNGHRRKLTLETVAPSPQASAANVNEFARDSPSPHSALQQQRQRADSRGAARPMSMIQTYSPATMDVNGDTPPELQPIFSFLNSHSNKLYQEGYFLKLHDLDSRGRPSAERNWTECFAQLVGTVLSLWDAAALDAAGEEGEVLPTFINLSDASIKMIESLPMNGASGGNLQNVLSISTAANNRYLLHFNSLNSLTQWTAGIRLAMYEHATLQEAYTGSLIAGKGRMLNGIKAIMERSRFKSEDWARVRFGAGTPWRRCWCVISPPDEKEFQKQQKSMKKKNPYGKTQIPKGDIKFYDTRRITKKTRPIATITDAYAAYAIYPQSKPLIDQSTLVKVEGLITIHSTPETTTEGFLFVMPEVHPAVTGFEMMLRWLFPVWDTYTLYGRPNRLIADTLDSRGLMFAMPRDRRYGYLDILDVSGLIHTEGSQAWSERQWRTELKKLTSHRMNAGDGESGSPLRQRSKTTSRTSLPGMINNRNGVKFDEDTASQSSPVSRKGSPAPQETDLRQNGPRRAGTAPVNGDIQGHRRSVSDAMNYKRYQTDTPSRLSIDSNRGDMEQPPQPPTHGVPMNRRAAPGGGYLERVNSEQESPPIEPFEELHMSAGRMPVTPVAQPPEFLHNPSAKPSSRPFQAPELRRATSKIDAATLHQMHEASHQDDRQGPPYQANGPPHEVAIDAKRSAGVPTDKSPRKELVNRVRNDQLPTIPASPSAQDLIFQNMNGPAQQSEQPPQPPQHSAALRPEAAIARKPSPSGKSLRDQSLGRKPVPRSTPSPQPSAHLQPDRPDSRESSTPSSVGGLSDQVIDSEALEQILQDDRTSTMNSSIPDYDSVDQASVKSGPKNKNVEKQRTGRLKTVGDPTMATVAEESRARSRSASRLDTFFKEQEAEKNGEMPAVDFGPTYTYKPTGRPGSRGAMTPNLHVDGAGSPGTSPISTGQRTSYFGGRGTPSPNGMTPIDSADPSKRRSMVWQPGNNPFVEGSAKATLTPEQWVQHRASIASQPMALRSTPNLGNERPPASKRHSSIGITPPMSRTPSGDWSQAMQQASPQGPSRPTSRNAGALLQSSSSTNLLESNQPRNLTARERMHVSRATGTPLVDLAKKDPRKQQEANAGLYAALQAREKEKVGIKQGYQSSTVQNAISQKQYLAQADMQSRMTAQFQMQQQQAAQAAQAAHYNAQMQQQAAFNSAYTMQQQQQQHMGNAQPRPQQQPRQQQMQGQRTSQYYDPYQVQGVPWQNPVMQQQQAAPQQGQYIYQPSHRSSYYGGYAASTRPSPR